ncbi:MAG: sugar ABC transporter permease [Bacteroides sp.]|nr:sugar ABC transporter permease [Eubacterium sp.]MCM1418901.1 sugar ABC transporter permease [Roseburia sp.]MCM1461509.1 sugar ABC transporter permease [Bacteroides sp.]
MSELERDGAAKETELNQAPAEQPAAEATEPIEEPKPKKHAAHMTASAAALNAEGEVDIRRRKPREEKKIKESKISYERKKGLYGYGFVALWLVGVIYMFIIPLGQSLWYSLCRTELVSQPEIIEQYGMSGPGIYTEWNDFGNYKKAFTENPDYPQNLVQSLTETAYTVPLVLVFSLFVALLLNDKFKGRTLARAVFFLPVLIATGPVLQVINGDMLAQGVGDASQFSALFKADFVEDFLQFMGLNNISQTLADTVSEITGTILNLIWDSGIQILIFISALQQIPVSAKEAASMEGATGWEFFWKITFPTISPMIFANLIYTVIDAFVKSDNPVMQQVMSYARAWEYGFSAAMAWAYFAIVAAILGIISAIVSRFIFYQVD